MTDFILDLIGLNITNGDCVNNTVPQNVTFGEQGGVLNNGSIGVMTSSGYMSYMNVIVCAVIGFFSLF